MPGMIVYLQYLIPQKLAGLTDNSNYCFYILAIHNGSAFIPPSVLNKTGFPFHDRNSSFCANIAQTNYSCSIA